MTLYKGNQKIRDEGSYGVYKGNQPIRAIYKGSQKLYWQQLTTTFNVSDSFQTYTVPANVTKLRIDCVASKGGSDGGNGGRVQCDLNVTAGQTLYIMVGSQSNDYNASDIRTSNAGVTNTTSLNSRLVVAGGGGRKGWSGNAGGAGGNTTGGTGGNSSWGDSYGGGGGTQSVGGAGGGHGNVFGYNGDAGSFGLGAKRNDGGSGSGSGGAGWYGGGSGGAGWYVGWEADRVAGGGGGSSYTNSSLCSNVAHTQGYQNGAGYITITEIG